MKYRYLHRNVKSCYQFMIIKIIFLMFVILFSICYAQISLINSGQEKIEWLNEVRVTSTPSNSNWPDLATDSQGNVYIVWKDDRDSTNPPFGNNEIYYTKLDNNGNILSNDTRISRSPGYSCYPRIAIDSYDNIHIVWRDGDHGNNNDYDVYYTKINVKGDIVIDTMVVGIGSGYISQSLIPAIGLDSKNNLHIVWDEMYQFTAPDSQKLFDRRLCYTKINDDGKILIDKLQITPVWIHVREPALAVDMDDNLQIVWVDNSAPPGPLKKYWVIRYQKCDNNGNVIVEPFPITPAWVADSRYPSLVVDNSNNVHCIFNDWREKPELGIWQELYTKLNNIGKTIIEDTNISQNAYDCIRSCIAIDLTNNIHIVWYDPWSSPDYKLFYEQINNNGDILISSNIIDKGTSYSEDPRIGVDLQGNVHVIWSDYRNGNWDIYYRKGKAFTTQVDLEKDKFLTCMKNFKLFQNVPNPFNDKTTINYYLPEDSQVSLQIYTLTGELLRSLVSGKEAAGYHTVYWNTKNQAISSGIYLCQFIVNKEKYDDDNFIKKDKVISNIKLILLK